MPEYLLYFASIIIFGDAALIALLYFAASGTLNFTAVFTTALLATIATDLIWYAIGKWFPAGKLFGRLKIPTIKEKYAKFAILFEKHSLKALFYSKFIIGLRTPLRALYGARNLPIFQFTIVNAIAGALWILIIATIAHVLESNLPELENAVQETAIAFSILSLVTIGIYLVAQKIINKKISLDVENSKQSDPKSDGNVQ